MHPPTPSPATAADSLMGQTIDPGWVVKAKLPRPPGATGGNFSIGYLVDGPGGQPAFLKAIDYAKALRGPFTIDALNALVAAYVFERDLVRQCSGARLSRVVVGVSDGELTVPGFAIEQVPYLIFELADTDARGYLDAMASVDEALMLRSLHNVAVGIQQLHGQGIAHQDLKPSNVMVFKGAGLGNSDVSKVGDLGRARSSGRPAPHDGLPFAGDLTYAPPEVTYNYLLSDVQLRTRAAELYLFGSLVSFFFAGAGTTASMQAQLDPAYRHGAWGGTFRDVLPYLYDAFDRVKGDLESAVPEDVRRDVVATFSELCDPDPHVRGNPKVARDTVGRYALNRYVTVFDRLARTAEIAFTKQLAP